MEKEIIRIESKEVAPAVLTDDDWIEVNGSPLVRFVKGEAREYECVSVRRGELDTTAGWRDEYLRYLFNHLKSGKSYESFGGRYFISQGRKKQWEQLVPEWRAVKEFGLMMCREKWEQLGIDMAEGIVEKGNATVYIATMKALFKDSYGESKEVRHEVNVGGKMEVKITERKGSVPLLRNDEVYTDAVVINEGNEKDD